jgi:decaprenylphospho-beta-D-erythro-pentofuranosid-2-ulose 2-reductase
MVKYQHAIVIGASSGIGRQLVRQLAESGCKVAALARRREKLDEVAADYSGSVLPFVHDVTDFDSIPELFQTITGALGGLDLIVYCSGSMPEVDSDEFNFAKDREMIEVNDLGAVAWLNEAATRFRGTKHGTIVGIGSVAGDRGRMKQPVYNASKAFLHTYLEALRNRLDRHGVKVVTVKPGPVDTEMTAGLDIKNKMHANEAARLILQKSARTGEHYLNPMHAVAFMVIRNIPSWLFRRMNV